MTASAIYQGTIRHRRFAVRTREFSHPVALMYLDLEELGDLFGGRLQARRPGLVRFRRGDYLGDPSVPLVQAVREQLERATGSAPAGPIRLLTQLRTFGLCFNPVSFYYCFSTAERLEALVAEVSNTPWGERHAYAMRRTGDHSEGRVLSGSFDKQLHVSPFMGMEQSYTLHAVEPGESAAIHIESAEHGRRAFDATLSLRRVALTRRSLARTTARFPAASFRVLALIYAHALALRLKRVPVHRHPLSAR